MKILKFIAILLILAGSLASCKDESVNGNDIDPEKAILGKWELVLLTRNSGNDEQKYTPTGYFEYLPDSLMAWYDYATKKYTIFEAKYWLEKGINSDGLPYWILYYKDLWTLVDGIPHSLYPDSQGCDTQACTFFSNNRMGLHQLCFINLIDSYTYIYTRKK